MSHPIRGGRHKRSRDPRAHWLLLSLSLPAMFGLLMFQGWTTHEVDAAKTRPACTSPVPKDIVGGGPVVQINNGQVKTVSAQGLVMNPELLGHAADDGFRLGRPNMRTARSRNSSGYALGAGIAWSPLVRPI